MNLAWSMASGVWNSIPSLIFTSKNNINKHVWYSISRLVFDPNVGFASQVCEHGLEYGVWGLEFNSKLGVYKQE